MYAYMYILLESSGPNYLCLCCAYTKLLLIQIHVVILTGSCADIMHSAQPFRNGFKQEVIAVIIRDVVQGLEYLHNLGYVHRYTCT